MNCQVTVGIESADKTGSETPKRYSVQMLFEQTEVENMTCFLIAVKKFTVHITKQNYELQNSSQKVDSYDTHQSTTTSD